MRTAIVLVIDGLGAKHIGPHGNTWIETPAFNRLASESLLIQNLYSSFAGFQQTYQSLWRGKAEVTGDLAGTDLISDLNSRNISTRLFTDDAELTDLPLSSSFAHQMEMEAPTGVNLADEWDETHTANFFAQAIAASEDLTDNGLLWLHLRGFGNPWDAPYEFRSRFSDEDDPEPTGSGQVPSLELDEDYNPDTLHDIQCAFAGQVMLIDRCLQVLLSVIREGATSRNMLFVVTSPRGFPLGEHRRVGWEKARLHHELLHVPALLRYPEQQHAMQRRLGLSEAQDVSSFILEWFDGRSVAGVPRKFSISRNNNELLLRTPVWHQRFPDITLTDSEIISELYLKPDDQNEVNDVSGRCADVTRAGWEFVQSWLENPTCTVEVPELLLAPLE